MKIAGIPGWKPATDELVAQLLADNDTVRVTPDGGRALYSLRRDNELDPFLYCDKNFAWWIAPGMPGFNQNQQ